MSKITLLVGPPGSGKSTMAKDLIHNDGDHGAATVYVNQDSQGKIGHVMNFTMALELGKDIIVDRMGFDKKQRNRYLDPAKAKGYETEIRVLHQPRAVCMERCLKREGHETIKDEENAIQAINFFFKSYERVEDGEADTVRRFWPEQGKPMAIICDLDGTLANIEHRRHHVRKEEGFKKNWMAFVDGIKDDKVNHWCSDILRGMGDTFKIVYCSGRYESERSPTEQWLKRHGLDHFFDPIFEKDTFPDLYMRPNGDSRHDYIIKEILLDFEILTRYRPHFMIDDRQQVVDMWRRRGFTCLQCDVGDF